MDTELLTFPEFDEDTVNLFMTSPLLTGTVDPVLGEAFKQGIYLPSSEGYTTANGYGVTNVENNIAGISADALQPGHTPLTGEERIVSQLPVFSGNEAIIGSLNSDSMIEMELAQFINIDAAAASIVASVDSDELNAAGEGINGEGSLVSFMAISSGDDASQSSQKSKSSQRRKITKMWELDDSSDPKVERAKKAKTYRESKKQETEVEKQQLKRRVEELEAEVKALKRKETLPKSKAVNMIENIRTYLKVSGGGDILVSPELADKQVPKLSLKELRKIADDASVAEGKRFKMILYNDDNEELVCEKLS